MAAPPANKVANLDMPWLVLVMRNDPDWSREKTRELEYDFSAPGRRFHADPTKRGAYGAGFSQGFGPGYDSVFADRQR